MIFIQEKLTGTGETLDIPLDDAIRKAMSDRIACSIWWIFGGNNVKLLECNPSSKIQFPKLDWSRIFELGWSTDKESFKCPLCTQIVTPNNVRQHKQKHFRSTQ